MKKIILSAMALLFVFMLANCAKKDPGGYEQRRIKRLDSYNAVGAIGSYALLEYDANNRLLNFTTYLMPGPVMNNRVNFEYFPDGRLNTVNTYNSSDVLAKIEVYIYDADEKLNTKNSYDGGMTLQGWLAYKYSADSRLSTRTAYSAPPPGVVNNFKVYEFDAQARPVKMTPYLPPDTAGSYWVMIYGANGKLQKRETRDVAGVLTMFDVFDYNENNELVKGWVYSPPDTVYSYSLPTYEAGTANYEFTDLLFILGQ